MHENYLTMKNSGSFDRRLFKSLEDKIDSIFTSNFYDDLMKETLWNPKYNKIINDSNQYMLEKEDEVNIFSKILEDKKFIELKSKNKYNSKARRGTAKTNKSMIERPSRNRRVFST